MTKKINSEIKDLETVFKGKHLFKIPEFQRDFVWGKEEVQIMLEDFDEDIRSFEKIEENEGYLLGNIVVIEEEINGKVYKKIIDGQQRITVLSILYYELEEYINSVIIPNINNKIDKEFQGGKITESKKIQKSNFNNQKWFHATAGLAEAYTTSDLSTTKEDQELKIQHASSLLIGEDYKYYIKKKNIRTEDNNLTEIASYIYSYLDGLAQEDKENYSSVLNFSKYIKTKVYLIETTAPSLSKAFQLFEVLNERGKGLEPLDLIKNILLKKLSEEDTWEQNISVFQNEWRLLTEFLNQPSGPKKGGIKSSTFLKHFIIGTEGINIGKSKLFDHFNKMNLTTEKTLNLVKNMSSVAKTYSKIDSRDFTNVFNHQYNKEKYLQRLLKVIFHLLNTRQIHSLLIPFYGDSEENIKKVLMKAVQLSVTYSYSGSSSNEIERLLPTYIKEYLIQAKLNSQDALNNLLNNLSVEIKKKQHLLRETIKEQKFETKSGNYNRKSVHLYQIIEMFELEDTSLTEDNNAKISLDHISPRTLPIGKTAKDIGFKDEAQRLEYMNNIGNLCLIKRGHNASMGNNLIKEKREHYKQSTYWTTVILAEQKETPIKSGIELEKVNNFNEYMYNENLLNSKGWGVKEIKERAETIANYVSYLMQK